MRFSAGVIGEGSLVATCVEILRQAHDVRVVFCADPNARLELEARGVRVVSPTVDIAAELAASPIDWLFSIVNPRILRPEILAIPRAGTINYHDSPLPRYAGMHATTWALLNGETQHAVTWHRVTPEIDAGEILQQQVVRIEPTDTVFSLNVRCAEAAVSSFRELLGDLEDGITQGRAQDATQRTYFAKHHRPVGGALLRPSLPAVDLERLVRALSFAPTPNPIATAKISWGGELLSIGSAQLASGSGRPAGSIIAIESGRMRVATGDGDVSLGAITTLTGDALTSTELEERRQRAPSIDEPDAATFDRITAAIAATARYERWWATRLTEVVPPDLRWAAPAETTDNASPVLAEVVPAAVAGALAGSDGAANLLAAVSVALARLGGPNAGHIAWTDAELESAPLVPGLFAPFVPVAVDVACTSRLVEVCRAAGDTLARVRAKQGYVLDVFARYPELRPLASTRALPIAISFGGAQAASEGAALTLQVVDGGRAWRWTSDPTRIEPAQVNAFAAIVARVLSKIAMHPARRVHELAMLGADERILVTETWNTTKRARSTVPVTRGLADQAQRSPDAVAVEDRRVRLTYRELDRTSNRIARWLVGRGVQHEQCVAVLMSRSADWIAVQAGVMKSGGAYLPLEPGDPAARVRAIVGDAHPALLLTSGERARGDLGVPCIDLDDAAIRAEIGAESDAPLAEVEPSQLAYVIYTSGTTGTPNGVAVEHRQLSEFVAEHARFAALGPTDHVSQMSSPAFDAGMSEIWPTLVVGASLHIVDDDLRMFLPDFAAWMSSKGITVAGMPTHMAEEALDLTWAGAVPRLITTGGATLKRRPGPATPFALANAYGPTETTVYVTTELVEPGAHRVSTIGRPIGNTQVFILGEDGAPLPVGFFGEMWIAGANVARGYLGRAALTAERFGPDPFGAGRRYRTGDRARWTPDGRVEFGGRIDHQVKLRGFRIELGEIEVAVASLAGVAHAVAVVREDRPGEQRLVAYVVMLAGYTFDASALKLALRDRLPPYMVPNLFVPLGDLPRTSGGKVDRAALPVPETAPRTAASSPRSVTEHVLLELWRQAFNLDAIGVDDEFHDLGGHSLLAMTLVRQIRERLDVEVALIELLESSTVAKLSTWIEELRAHGDEVVSDLPRLPHLVAIGEGTAPLTPPQRGTFMLDREAPTNSFTRVTWSAKLHGPLDTSALERALRVVRDRHGILHSRFVEIAGELRQEVVDPAQIAAPVLERVDLTSLDHEARDAADAELHRRLVAQPFALADGQPLRAVLVTMSPAHHRLTLLAHRIACDAESMLVLVDELGKLWRAFTEDATRDAAGLLPEVELQYADVATYLSRLGSSSAGATQRAYWVQQLAAVPPLELPNDLPRERVDAVREAKRGFATFPIGLTMAVISGEQAAHVRQLAERLHTTVHSTLLAAMAEYLHRWTGQEDLAILSHLSYRHLPGLARTVGLFANPLVMRISAAGAPTFSELVGRTHQVVTNSYERGECDVLGLAPAHLFRFWFNYISSEQRKGGELVLPAELAAEPMKLAGRDEAIAYDLQLVVGNRGDSITLTLAYNRELFTHERATRFIEGYVERLAALIESPHARAWAPASLAKVSVRGRADRSA